MKITNKLMPQFLVWLWRGQHKIQYKRKQIIVRKNDKEAIMQKCENRNAMIEINDYAYERWLIFLNQWFRIGKSFIDNLKKIDSDAETKLKQKTYMGLTRW